VNTIYRRLLAQERYKWCDRCSKVKWSLRRYAIVVVLHKYFFQSAGAKTNISLQP